jgi:hypothetical protein
MAFLVDAGYATQNEVTLVFDVLPNGDCVNSQSTV